MNDEFLKDYRQPPRPAFILSLRARLGHSGPRAAARPVFRPAALGALTIALALVFTLAISPAARAQLQDWVGQVGGVLFTVTGDYPGSDEPVTIVPSETLSLSDAREQVAFAIDLPAWVPDGYALKDTVMLTRWEHFTTVELDWRGPDDNAFFLTIQGQATLPSQWLVGPDSLEEVLVNGEPAALVRGGWDYNARQWKDLPFLTLMWTRGDLTYSLTAVEGYLTSEDLIRIAESMP